MKLDKRQKITLIITILAVLFLIWQIIDMVGGDVSSTRSAPKPAAKSAPAAQPASQPTPAQAAPTNASAPSQDNQVSEYAQLSQQYELAKMRAQLLTSQLKVAQTQNQIAKLNQQTAALSGGQAVSDSEGNPNQLHLVYLGKVNGQWQATVAKSGDYQTVSKGSMLPNGQLVKSIDSKGVLYREGNQQMRLSFNGSVLVAKKSSSTLPQIHSLTTRLTRPQVEEAKPAPAPIMQKTTTATLLTAPVQQQSSMSMPSHEATPSPVKAVPMTKLVKQPLEKPTVHASDDKKPVDHEKASDHKKSAVHKKPVQAAPHHAKVKKEAHHSAPKKPSANKDAHTIVKKSGENNEKLSKPESGQHSTTVHHHDKTAPPKPAHTVTLHHSDAKPALLVSQAQPTAHHEKTNMDDAKKAVAKPHSDKAVHAHKKEPKKTTHKQVNSAAHKTLTAHHSASKKPATKKESHKAIKKPDVKNDKAAGHKKQATHTAKKAPHDKNKKPANKKPVAKKPATKPASTISSVTIDHGSYPLESDHAAKAETKKDQKPTTPPAKAAPSLSSEPKLSPNSPVSVVSESYQDDHSLAKKLAALDKTAIQPKHKSPADSSEAKQEHTFW